MNFQNIEEALLSRMFDAITGYLPLCSSRSFTDGWEVNVLPWAIPWDNSAVGAETVPKKEEQKKNTSVTLEATKIHAPSLETEPPS